MFFGLSLLVLSLFAPSAAQAHLGSTKYLDVELGPGGATALVAVEAVDASMELGLGEEVREAEAAALRARSAEVRRWISEGVRLSGAGGPCGVDAGPVTAVTRDERAYLEVTLSFTCPGGGPYTLRDDTIFADDPQHEAFVRVLSSGETDARILRRGRQEAAIGSPPSSAELAGLYFTEGAIHLVTGYDHVLFLLSLMLAAGLVAARDGRRKALADIALLVTAFTLGHSVTLAAAALEWVVLPSRLVESAIALSIVAVAGLNIVAPAARRPMPYLAVGFGLVHGFGFSAVLAEQGLPGSQRVLALVAFNVGIEVAQLAFVAAFMVPLGALAKWEGYERVVVRGGSGVIAVIAGYWFVTRAFI
ncbi:MAG: hypothetical protein DRJ42_20515 [Deltaproteobacteria bacterium]|nr:MAG: hypothetical protein DRJ42_20515 [Deltaproteobacteria bacterium]